MEFNRTTTVGLFVALVAVGVLGLVASNVMPARIVLMMVAPSMLVFGAICLALGVKFGEYRAGAA